MFNELLTDHAFIGYIILFCDYSDLFNLVKVNRFISNIVSSNTDYMEMKYLLIESKIQLSKNSQAIFNKACATGRIKIAKWIYSFGQVSIHSGCEFCFRTSCGNGHLEIAKWLHSLGCIDIHILNDSAFEWACSNSKIDVVRWLITLDEFEIRTSILLEIFCSMCTCNQLDSAKYIYNLDPYILVSDIDFESSVMIYDKLSSCMNIVDNYIILDRYNNFGKRYLPVLFELCCILGHMEIVKWIYSFGLVDIHYDKDSIFYNVCKYNQLGIAKWLYDLDNENIYIDDSIWKCSKKKIRSWLNSIRLPKNQVVLVKNRN